MRAVTTAFLAAAFALTTPSASVAQTVYKCPKGNGHEYTTVPCDDSVKTWQAEPSLAQGNDEPAAQGSEVVRLLDWNCSGNSVAAFATGTVRNATQAPLRFLRVNVSFYNATGQILDTGFGFVSPNPLPSNMTGQFKVYGPLGTSRCNIDTWQWKTD